MGANNKKLKNEIKQKIMDKFGRNVSLTELYETILRRMVYDIRANLNETTMQFNKRINGELIISSFVSILCFHIPRIMYFAVLLQRSKNVTLKS